MVISSYGFDTYAVASLLAAIPALLPFADLGLGASVVNASSDLTRDRTNARAKDTVVLAVRATVLSAIGLASVGCITAAIDAWPSLLGVGAAASDVSLAGAIALTFVGIGVVLAMAGRALQGMGRVSQVYLLTSIGPILGLLVALAVVSSHPATALVGLAPFAGAIIASCLCVFPARRAYPGPILRDLLSRKIHSGLTREIVSTSSSSLIVTLGTVLAFQADRVILGHFSSVDQVGQYSLVAPMYIAGYALLNAVGQNLWPHYRDLKARSMMSTSVLNLDVLRSGLLAALGGLAIVLAGPSITSLMTGDTDVDVNSALFFAFAGLAIIQGIHLPSAMLLTDSGGWRFQRNVVIVMAVAKLILSVLFAPSMGSVGVVAATLASVTILQVPLTYLKARRAAAA
ncbi:O-antigen/teichoic acid export membrane protein [Microbacterium sp. SORGH_AS 1204]|nr:O-antigen/teichoic acid export membrane protein [Microbacterium sp. SORGH_AS_1204]